MQRLKIECSVKKKKKILEFASKDSVMNTTFS